MANERVRDLARKLVSVVDGAVRRDSLTPDEALEAAELAIRTIMRSIETDPPQIMWPLLMFPIIYGVLHEAVSLITTQKEEPGQDVSPAWTDLH